MTREQRAGSADVPLRAAVYCRVSSAGQEDNSSLGTQEASCRAYAVDQGWTVAAVYREVHTGAELFERPELTRLREAMRRGEFDVLLVHALDRLSRKQTHQGLVLSEAEHAGVAWHSATEAIDDSPQGQILRAVIGGMAEMERLKISERTVRGRKARAEAGKLLPGRAALYGYRWRDATKGACDVDPVTGPIVQRMFREMLNGVPLRRIASHLTEEGIPTPTLGKTWSASSIHTMLKRRAYTGEAVAWQYGSEKLRGGGSRIYIRPEEEQTKLPDGTIPPLISEADFEAVQARLARNKEAASRNNRTPEITLLRGGFGRCGYCGTFLNVTRKKNLVLYRHGTRTVDHHGCPPVSIKADRLDEAVWERVESILTRPEVISAEVARAASDDQHHADLAAIERRIRAMVRKEDNLVKRLAMIEDDDVATAVMVEMNSIARERRQLQAELDEAAARHADRETARAQLTAVEDWCRQVAGNLAGFSYDQKRQALEALGVEARLFHTDHEPRYEISASIPFDGPVVSTASSTSGATVIRVVATVCAKTCRALRSAAEATRGGRLGGRQRRQMVAQSEGVRIIGGVGRAARDARVGRLGVIERADGLGEVPLVASEDSGHFSGGHDVVHRCCLSGG